MVSSACTWSMWDRVAPFRADSRLVGSHRPAATLANSGSPGWSPDGSKLAFTSEAGDVVVIGADGSGSRVLAAIGGNPRWSPDGRRIAFYRTVDPSEYFNDRPCTARIWVIDFRRHE